VVSYYETTSAENAGAVRRDRERHWVQHSVHQHPIANLIYVVRGHRVMLDSDLARLYGVPTKRLNEQVKRNRARFPEDFGFRLTASEVVDLRSQIATSSVGPGGRRYAPLVFTEHGAVMLASVLSSRAAVETSIQVVRAFVQLRGVLVAHADLARKLAVMEAKHDKQFGVVFEAIRELMAPPAPPRKRIGFRVAPD
jgi:hypothetical protein